MDLAQLLPAAHVRAIGLATIRNLAGAGASHDCGGLLTPALLLRQNAGTELGRP